MQDQLILASVNLLILSKLKLVLVYEYKSLISVSDKSSKNHPPFLKPYFTLKTCV